MRFLYALFMVVFSTSIAHATVSPRENDIQPLLQDLSLDLSRMETISQCSLRGSPTLKVRAYIHNPSPAFLQEEYISHSYKMMSFYRKFYNPNEKTQLLFIVESEKTNNAVVEFIEKYPEEATSIHFGWKRSKGRFQELNYSGSRRNRALEALKAVSELFWPSEQQAIIAGDYVCDHKISEDYISQR